MPQCGRATGGSTRSNPEKNANQSAAAFALMKFAKTVTLKSLAAILQVMTRNLVPHCAPFETRPVWPPRPCVDYHTISAFPVHRDRRPPRQLEMSVAVVRNALK